MIRFSVIVPTRNRPDDLARCLHSLRRLDYPAEHWELIVVNDGGDALAHEALGATDATRVVEIEHAGPGAARNAGAVIARGEHLAFVDDDCRVDPGWLRAYEAGFRDGDADALGGSILNPFPGCLASQVHERLLEFLYTESLDTAGHPLMLVSANAAYRKEVFDALGGFDPGLRIASEDRELGSRLLASGYRQRYCPQARLWHHRRTGPAAFVRMQFRYGRGQAQLRAAQRRFGRIPSVPRSSALRFWAPLVRRMRSERAPLRAYLLVGTAQAAHRLGSSYQAWIERD